MQKMKLRLAELKDTESILKVHYDSVRHIAYKNYNQQILNDWSPPVTTYRIRSSKRRLKNKFTIVAEINNKIVGFGTLAPKEREIRAVYVSSKAKRKGIGTALLKKLESIAKEKGIKELHLESSITAEKFYNKNVYESLGYGYFTLRTGRKMRSVKMRKIL